MADYGEALGPLAPAVGARLKAFRKERTVGRLWAKDPTLWKTDPGVAKAIRNRLGWLDVATTMKAHFKEIQGFVDAVMSEGYTRALLLGMGGSSLSDEVLQRMFGTRKGYLELRVLDSTDPAEVRAAEEWAWAEPTIFLVCSKSGTTAEVLSFFKYFHEKLGQGDRFTAITDPGSPLDGMAKRAGFRHVFTNPPDIGGRYSALSLFGLAPGALVGIDAAKLLSGAERMMAACREEKKIEQNPGVRLGVILGEAARAGRNKLTLLLSPDVASFGSWIEQLVAESTGKEAKGILPIDGEPAGPPRVYGNDRVFVYVRSVPTLDDEATALERTGHPVVRIGMGDPYDIGGEFVRWEIATAVAGAILGINPFDEPNVRESKDLTRGILQKFERTRRLPTDDPPPVKRAAGLIGDRLNSARRDDFFALLAYLPRTAETHYALQEIRRNVRDRKRIATTVGYGPRYLHSTGQLFKGGTNSGIYLQITGRDEEDPPIPGQPYGFSTLKRAQAMGDYQALRGHDRRVIRCTVDDVSEIAELLT
ncbi:MAG: hypothetical protein ACYTAF_04755 [Planctomycetota bacterium]